MFSSFTRARGCVAIVKQTDPDDEGTSLTGLEMKQAKVKVRGDLALLVGRGDDGNIGLRKIDGDWRVDDMLTPSLDQQRRGETRLTRGSDEQQIRATAAAANDALSQKDYKRFCNLMSPGAEAQVMLGGAFAAMFSSAKEPSEISCATLMRTVARLADDDRDVDGGLAGDLPSRAEMRLARITIRGSHATIDVPGDSPAPMIRVDGRWLVDAEIDEPLTAADYRRCWQAAGARIATRAGDLRFADEGEARHLSATMGRMSVKGENWRIFYTMPEDGADPGVGAVIHQPRSAAAVAYVKDAAAHPDVVAAARDCGGD
jgi:hypothetical protein